MGGSPTTLRRELKRKFESAIDALTEAQRLMAEQRLKVAKIEQIRKEQEAVAAARFVEGSEEVQRVLKRVVATFAYAGAVPGEDLDFGEEEVIEVMEEVDDNWYAGRVGSRTGIFPRAYVRDLVE